MKKTLILLLATAFSFFSVAGVSALTQQQLFSLNNDSVFYQPGGSLATSGNCSLQGNVQQVNITATGTGVWTSGVQPPYYLEEFAINVLEDLAATTNVNTSAALTPQHVLALIAWFHAEAGGTGNSDVFNPLNSSLNEPGASLQTTQDYAYPGFDAGVQATVQTMVGSQLNRVAEVLTNPNSTAMQVVQVITYYQDYAGNDAWATADIANQQSYLNALESNVTQASSNYVQEASVGMGSPYQTNNVQGAPLQYAKYFSSAPTSNNPPINVSGSCSPNTPASSGTYQNPFRNVANLAFSRIDQGVDLSGTGPVYALGDGQIVNTSNSGWPGSNFIVEYLSDGPAQGDYVYVAEGCTPSVSNGQQVNSTTIICDMNSSGIETGWATPSPFGAALANSQFNHKVGNVTAYGLNYAQLLNSLGLGVIIPTVNISATGTVPSNWPSW